MTEELLGLPSVAFWLPLLLRRLVPALLPSGFLGTALGGGLRLRFILLLVGGRGIEGFGLFHGVLRDFSCRRPKWVDDMVVGLGVEQYRCEAGLQVQYGNPGNFSFISLRKWARCLMRRLLRSISSNGEGGEGGQSMSAACSFGVKTPAGKR